jgi:phage/plasmid-like protein (TIGR03299 family)
MDSMPAAVETMVSTGRQVPWHGLGVVVDDPTITTARAIELAGLDWTVEKEQITRTTKGGLTVSVPNKFFNVRSSDEKVLGIVSGNFNNLQNRDAFAFADNLVDSGEALVETAGALRGGRVIFLTMRLPGQLMVDGEDAHEMYLLFRMGHDGTMAIAAEIVTIRVVCMNTLIMASTSAKQRWSIIHTQKIDGRLAEAREALKLAYAYGEEFVELGNRMVATKFSDDDLIKLLEDTLPNRPKTSERIESIIDVFNNSETNPYHGTAWGAFNAITEYYDHMRDTKSQEGVFTQIMDGEISAIRKKAEKILLSI